MSENAMISIEDCIAMCGLTREEVDAIAEHEHIEEIAAAALANYLMDREGGPRKIRAMIHDAIRAALARCDKDHARALLMAPRHLMHPHPERL